MAQNKRYDIFLSHSSSDKEFTDKLQDLLELSGFNVLKDDKKLAGNII